MGTPVHRGGFITEATKLLSSGRPAAALDMLYRYSDNIYARRTDVYWRLRAAAIFLSQGKKAESEAFACLAELPAIGADREFLDLYVAATRALACRRLPVISWTRRSRHQLVDYNILTVVKMAEAFGRDGDKLEAELSALRPKS